MIFVLSHLMQVLWQINPRFWHCGLQSLNNHHICPIYSHVNFAWKKISQTYFFLFFNSPLRTHFSQYRQKDYMTVLLKVSRFSRYAPFSDVTYRMGGTQPNSEATFPPKLLTHAHIDTHEQLKWPPLHGIQHRDILHETTEGYKDITHGRMWLVFSK